MTKKSIRFFATSEDHKELSQLIKNSFSDVKFVGSIHRKEEKEFTFTDYTQINDDRYIHTTTDSFETNSYLRIILPHSKNLKYLNDPYLTDETKKKVSVLEYTTIDSMIDQTDDQFKNFISFIFKSIRKQSKKVRLINPNLNEYSDEKVNGLYTLKDAYLWSEKENNYLKSEPIFNTYYKP